MNLKQLYEKYDFDDIFYTFKSLYPMADELYYSSIYDEVKYSEPILIDIDGVQTEMKLLFEPINSENGNYVNLYLSNDNSEDFAIDFLTLEEWAGLNIDDLLTNYTEDFIIVTTLIVIGDMLSYEEEDFIFN